MIAAAQEGTSPVRYRAELVRDPECELWFRRKITVNTDQQRRCCDGVNFSEEQVWTGWGLIGPYSLADALSSAATFQTINRNNQYMIRPL